MSLDDIGGALWIQRDYETRRIKQFIIDVTGEHKAGRHPDVVDRWPIVLDYGPGLR